VSLLALGIAISHYLGSPWFWFYWTALIAWSLVETVLDARRPS
jgi:hypothetical protein